MKSTRDIGGIVFDKDGTLFDFHTTWASWAMRLMQSLSDAHGVPIQHLADAADFDLGSERINPTSALIAATNRECAEALATAIPGIDIDVLEHEMMISSADVPLAPSVPLEPFLNGLRSRGLRLGVMTNDTEYGARAHLSSAGVLERFDFVAGFDSGHGAKPAPGPLLAFAHAVGIAPETAVMVGDSTHDLIAGRRAGMHTIGVLTGIAEREDLLPHADVVLPDIGHIPAWLDG
ncbi:HAD family hydrolase [Roseovarius pelagicus]|uniref:phosphoglycolate phosphatase n=1 Tax=Roseovarius pelagicus TaxID=2980108 RepID=A0ABY6DCT1_9RHOB|nr:HAD family hydrolase [Roseovarius pelagicus]UXX82813.1 HAD family hydrolase [Roseovarius pelagicus]